MLGLLSYVRSNQPSPKTHRTRLRLDQLEAHASPAAFALESFVDGPSGTSEILSQFTPSVDAGQPADEQFTTNNLNPAAPPRATMTFPAGTHTYTMTLEITTAGGSTHKTSPLTVEQNSAEAARDLVYNFLRDDGYVVSKLGTDGIEIKGKYKPDGSVDEISSGTLTIGGNSQVKPKLTGANGVTVHNAVDMD